MLREEISIGTTEVICQLHFMQASLLIVVSSIHLHYKPLLVRVPASSNCRAILFIHMSDGCLRKDAAGHPISNAPEIPESLMHSFIYYTQHDPRYSVQRRPPIRPCNKTY